MLVNLAVVALSYLAGGSRAFGPQAGRVGCPPSAEQRYIVRNIEESLMQWCPQDLFLKDLALGRKGTELASFLDLLAQKVGDEGAVG